MRELKPATQLDLALRQGGDAARDVVESGGGSVSLECADIVRLYICYERDGDPVCAQRFARYLEGGASMPIVIPPEPLTPEEERERDAKIKAAIAEHDLEYGSAAEEGNEAAAE